MAQLDLGEFPWIDGVEPKATHAQAINHLVRKRIRSVSVTDEQSRRTFVSMNLNRPPKQVRHLDYGFLDNFNDDSLLTDHRGAVLRMIASRHLRETKLFASCLDCPVVAQELLCKVAQRRLITEQG